MFDRTKNFSFTDIPHVNTLHEEYKFMEEKL